VLAGDLLILNCYQDVDSYLLAVNKRTGKTLWRTDRPAFRRGFSTPLPYPAENPVQLVVPGTLRLVSYNLSDGEERWYVRGLPNELVSSPTAGDGLVFVAGWTSGPGVRRMPAFSDLLAEGDEDSDGRLTRKEAPAGPAKQHFVYIDANKDGSVTRDEYESLVKIFAESKNVAMAVRPDGKGDVTETHIVWEARRGLPYVPSPLVYDGRLFLVRNGGLASCFDAKTGKAYYQQERLGALGDYYASPVAAAGKICVASRQGTVVICRAADSLDVLARNKLGESILATPAIVDGVLYIRTSQRMYAFSEVKGSGAE
jgi:outer membrane protein assembly factor BamB